MDQVARENPDAQVVDQNGKAQSAADAIDRIDALEEQVHEEGAKAFNAAANCFLRSS
jgi:hypothetical protein